MDRENDLLARHLPDADSTIQEVASGCMGGAAVLKQVIRWQHGCRYIDAKTVNGAPFTGTRYHCWSFPSGECVVLTETNKVFEKWEVIEGDIDDVVDKSIANSVA